MSETKWLKTDGRGCLLVPAGLFRAAGIAGDEPVHVTASEHGEHGIEILSRQAALKRANEIARQFVPEGASLVDELIAERRREASLENDDA
jgi:hypothetical protein